MKTLTAADRSALIRLASTLPKGSEERKAILAGLSKGASRFNASVMFPVRVTVETPVAVTIHEGRVVGSAVPRHEDVAIAAKRRGAILSLHPPSLKELEKEAGFQGLLDQQPPTSKAAGWTRGVYDDREIQQVLAPVEAAARNAKSQILSMLDENEKMSRTYAMAGMDYRDESKAARETRAKLSATLQRIENILKGR